MSRGFIDVTANAQQFNREVGKFAAKFSKPELMKFTKAVVFRLWVKLMTPTPKDTGRARANWQMKTKPDNSTVESFSPNVAPLPPKVENALIYWIFNNTDYLEELEKGHSQQAADGWIANVIANFGDEVKAVAKAAGME